ncbi:hypothetical protein [Sphaerisporangium dianthi]|uniref:Uncharacterized protein n=1 Tax=Sphaerisporangium dianthi TaxID=1436120 RepID=A0ABV9CDL6_9ACTN
MRIPWRQPAQNAPFSTQPTRLPQRWVLILGLSGNLTTNMTTAMGPGVGLPAGLAAVGLLHSIMD